MDRARLLESLDPDQRRAVTAGTNRLAVLAGPGAGKTRVLTRRAAWRIAAGDADPARTLVVTFTRRAAGELRERLRALGLGDTGTEPGGLAPAGAGPTVCTLHALAFGLLQRHGRRPAVARYPLRLLAPLVASAGLERSARQVAGQIGWAKARCLSPDVYAAAHQTGDSEAVADVYRAYEVVKADRGVVDVDDVLALATDLLWSDPAVAAAVQWHHRHVLVDEFQDVSRTAFRLLRAVTGDDPDLCVVGDPDQAVYGFAGSDPRLLTRLGEAVSDLTVVRLEGAHRCPAGIRAPAAALLGRRAPTDPGGGEGTSLPLTLDGHPDDEAEAVAVVWQLRQARAAGRAWSDLAVLARTNGRLDAVAAACKRAGVPTRSRRSVLDRADTRRGLDALLDRPLNLPAAVVAGEVRERAAAEPSSPGLATLSALALEYATTGPGNTLDGFLAWLDGTVRPRGGEPVDPTPAVDLLTFHRAKGLEWPTVFLVGVEAGTVPLGRALASEELAEERRLVYVALTRASAEVRISWAGDPSPWVEIIAGAGTPDPVVHGVRARSAVGRLRDRLSDGRADQVA